MHPSTALKRKGNVTLKTAAACFAVAAGVAPATLSFLVAMPAVSAQPVTDGQTSPVAPAAPSNLVAPLASTPRVPAGSVLGRNADPLKLYREAGIDKEQEYKIRKLAKTFEEQQRVRIGLLGNLLKDMRKLELQPDPDEKKALDKQSEINKIQAEIGTERIKLLLNIRNVLTFEQKERLVQNIQKSQASLFEK